jgi:4-carboxymuconolactone decarboxylase
MVKRSLVLMTVVAAAIGVRAQAPALPPDIHPVTLSRFAPVTPADLDAEGQKILAARTNPPTPGPGPGAAGGYSPKTSEGRGLIGRALGVPSGENFPLGNRIYQLVVLMTARDIDQQYEWSAHEPAGLRAGLEQRVIDVVKYDRPVDGLAEKDATLIRFFRALLREHRVSSDLFAKMIATFGKQRTAEMIELAGDYWTVGTMMNAGDQHLPATRQALMAPLARDGRRVD